MPGVRGEWGMYQRRSDGLWIGYVVRGTKPNGQPDRVTCSSKDRATCDAKLLRLRNELAAGVVVSNRATVRELMQKYQAEQKYKLGEGASGYVTIRVHAGHITRHLGDARLNRLTPGQVERMMVAICRESVTERKPRGTTATALRCRDVLRAAWFWARRERMISGDNPAELARPDVVSHEKKPRKVLTVAQIKTVMNEPHPLHALFVLAFCTGMRQSELLHLRWDDIDWHEESIAVRGTKTAASRGAVLLAPIAIEALREHRKAQMRDGRMCDWVWHSRNNRPLDPRHLRRQWYALLAAHDIGHIDWHHGTRHTLGDLLRADGVPLQVVQSVLRHALLSTTSTIYAPAQVGEQRIAVGSVQRILGD